jgi:hypothetical protein
MHCKVVPNTRGKKPWAVDWTDGDGKRRLKPFGMKKDAETFRRKLESGLDLGTEIQQIRPVIGRVNLAKLTSIRLQALLEDVRAKHEYRHVLVHCVLKLALEFAVRNHLLGISPLSRERVRLPSSKRVNIRVASKEEIRALLFALERIRRRQGTRRRQSVP